MIRTRETSDPVSTGLMAVAGVILLGALGFLIFVKRPNVNQARFAHVIAQKNQHTDLLLTQAKIKDLAKQAAPYVWTTSVDSVGPAALAKVTALAKTRQIKLSAFRPERTTDSNGLTQVPFLVAVDGGFSNTIAFLRDLEGPDSKLAVSQAQMSSSEGNSDKVTASIGIVAYVKLENTNG